MTEREVHSTIKPLIMAFLQELMKNYWGPLYHYIKDNPDLIKTVPGFLLEHKKVIVYIGRTHIAIEYTGPEVIEELESEMKLECQDYDYSAIECNLF